MIVSKAAHTFYFTFAMMKAVRYYLYNLIEEKEVSMSLKADFRTIIRRIDDLEKTAYRSLSKDESDIWGKEWKERDYEVFASVFSAMNDMTEEQRAVMEEFAFQLKNGEVKAEFVDAELIEDETEQKYLN